jgi:3'-phosphoadenosine 5'-phosphosulfate (PAPS) 3'-phosphatase
MKIQLGSLLSLAVHLSECAGNQIRAISSSGRDLETAHKTAEPTDVVTVADSIAQSVIESGFAGVYGSALKLVGEEDIPAPASPHVTDPSSLLSLPPGAAYDQDDLCVWIDPLDGTWSFVRGVLEEVSVLIGIAARDASGMWAPVAGVIHFPFRPSHPTFWGGAGVGLSSNIVAHAPRTSRTLRVATSTSHHDSRCACALQAVRDQAGLTEGFTEEESWEAVETLRVGGAGNKLAALMANEGDVYLYPREGTSRWDSCAGDAILRAMGGACLTVDGDFVDYAPDCHPKNSRGIIACRTLALARRLAALAAEATGQ